MQFRNLFKSNSPPFELFYRQGKDGDCLELFIDQKKIDPANNRVAGVFLTYPRPKDTSLPISYSFALEPSQNIDALAQLLQSRGLSTQIDPPAAMPRSIRSRLKNRGIEYGGLPMLGIDTNKTMEKIEHYSGVVRPYRDEGKKVNYAEPVFEVLKRKENGFLAESAIAALEMAIQDFRQSDPAQKFNTRSLEQKLADKLTHGTESKTIPDRR